MTVFVGILSGFRRCTSESFNVNERHDDILEVFSGSLEV